MQETEEIRILKLQIKELNEYCEINRNNIINLSHKFNDFITWSQVVFKKIEQYENNSILPDLNDLEERNKL